MPFVLGIDPAWTEREPSGIALVEVEDTHSKVLCVAPSYQQFIQESRRSDAVISLMRMAASAERYYADQKSFTGATAAGLMGGTGSVDGYYTLAMTIDGGGQGYTASATPVAGKSQADDDCYAYLLTSTGLKSNQDSGGTEIPDPSCWPE